MPDHRDNLPKTTPPAGIAAQIAGPPVKSRSLTPIEGFEMEPTGVGALPQAPEETMVAAIDRRSRETKNASIAGMNGSLATINLVENLRRETREDIGKLSDKVDGVVTAVAHQKGQNDQILSRLDDISRSRERVEQVVTTTRIAEVEVDKTRQLSDIEIEHRAAEINLKHREETQAIKRRHFDTLASKVVAAVAVIMTAAVASIGAGKLSCNSTSADTIPAPAELERSGSE